MKTIGQFAKENNVTVKTLHHYEKIELLIPKEVDNQNGYRYYNDDSTEKISMILTLKELGFSLSEIKDVLNSDDLEVLKKSLEKKKNQTKKDRDLASKRLMQVDFILNTLQNTKINCKELLKMVDEQVFTGKYGRSEFITQSEKMFEYAKMNNTKLSVVQMDLDHFHDVNKQFGHDVGDIVLDRTQSEILYMLEKLDVQSILERKGGDEFSITIAQSPLETSKMVSKILNNICNVDYSDVADGLKISMSAGIAGITKRTKSYTKLVHEATIKLYQAKRGR
jgi:diguanylate cyclase (GGDEF)-like protein